MRRTFPLCLALLLGACHHPAPPAPWLGAVEEVGSPAPPGSRFPNLAGGGDLPVVMSWLQAGAGDEFSLQHAEWRDRDIGAAQAWSAPREVARGGDWFVNWADFPSVVPVTARVWAAHWLQQKPGSVYSYDVRISVSDDGGRRWSPALTPHADGTPTEHGFVSLLRSGEDHVRAVWLDGRRTPGEQDHDSGHGGGSGAMTLRSAEIAAPGRLVAPDAELDGRVCDCCQTDAVAVGDATVVVFRDRDEEEVRNIRALRIEPGDRLASAPVHDDGWKIAACPVNGPAIAAQGQHVAVAWFTAADVPRVRLAFSSDGARTFGPALEVDSGQVAGRVDVAFISKGRAVVSWMAHAGRDAELRVRPYTEQGPAGAAVTVARVGQARASGFPQMIATGRGLLFAWTATGTTPAVHTAFAPLP